MSNTISAIKILAGNYTERIVYGCMKVMIGWKQTHISTLSPTWDRVCWQGKKTVFHWGLYSVVNKTKPWVIAQDLMYLLGYVI